MVFKRTFAQTTSSHLDLGSLSIYNWPLWPFENSDHQRLLCKCYSEFLFKNPNPLWKNPNFFIHLSFKKNEDVNPTKASHRGMNPKHLALAKQELSTLLLEGLIEHTTFLWACEAFYVNKHAKWIRGKLRLVINYQVINHFLADDKFPLLNKSAFFQHPSNTKVFSKFDLKEGFWQLGIHPEERYKTTFWISDHH